ncbi:hypothetical protein DENSPDRAFT_898238 [Dentipellis sp. KUC8613]|nr:hypothetical protein DENSPDRAFT_898238 [Dentipellis sp. KUC8613]
MASEGETVLLRWRHARVWWQHEAGEGGVGLLVTKPCRWGACRVRACKGASRAGAALQRCKAVSKSAAMVLEGISGVRGGIARAQGGVARAQGGVARAQGGIAGAQGVIVGGGTMAAQGGGGGAGQRREGARHRRKGGVGGKGEVMVAQGVTAGRGSWGLSQMRTTMMGGDGGARGWVTVGRGSGALSRCERRRRRVRRRDSTCDVGGARGVFVGLGWRCGDCVTPWCTKTALRGVETVQRDVETARRGVETHRAEDDCQDWPRTDETTTQVTTGDKASEMRDRELNESAGDMQSAVQLVFQVQYDTDEIDSLRNYGRGREGIYTVWETPGEIRLS